MFVASLLRWFSALTLIVLLTPLRSAHAEPINSIFLPLISISGTPVQTSPSAETPLNTTPEQDLVLALVNAYRQASGCSALQFAPELMLAAQTHSNDMSANHFQSHTGSDGSTMGERVRRTGYQFLNAGENIAAGYSNPDEVFKAWIDSPPHRANIANCVFQETGIGLAHSADGTIFWTEVFGTR